MLVLLGGFLGSGRRLLARELALRHGLFLYDLDRFRVRMPTLSKTGEYRTRRTRIRSQAEKFESLLPAFKEFPAVSRMYTDVIMERHLARRDVRTRLFEELKKNFEDIRFVWIESSDEEAEKIFALMFKNQMIVNLQKARKRRSQEREKFDPFKEAPALFECTADIEGSAARLWEMVSRMDQTKSLE